MKLTSDNKYVKIGLTIFFTAIAIMLAYFLFFRLDTIMKGIKSVNRVLAPIYYGLIMAYLMTPLLNVIEKKWILPWFNSKNILINDKKRKNHIRMICVTLTLLIVLFLIYTFFATVIPQLYLSLQSLISQFSTYTSNISEWLSDLSKKNPEIAAFLMKSLDNYTTEADDFLRDIVLPSLQKFLLPNINSLLNSVSASLMKILHFVWNFIIGLIISIYVLSGKEKFAAGSIRLCYAILSRKSANKFIDSVRFTHRTFIGFLTGKVIDSLIIGIICYVGCLIMKMPYAVLISVIVGVTNIVPIFGPYIGAIPSILIILLVDPMKALYFAIFIIILQQFDGNYLGPKILSQSTGLTSFWIIFSITLFGGFFQIVGMIVGVPITAVVASGIQKITDNRLKKKNLPTEVEAYEKVGYISEDGEITQYEYKKPESKKNLSENSAYKLFSAIGSFIKKLAILIFESIKALCSKIAIFIKKKFSK